jgi:hypothetical protein
MVPPKLASSFLPGRDGTFAESDSLEGVIDG